MFLTTGSNPFNVFLESERYTKYTYQFLVY